MKIKNYISGLALFTAMVMVSCDREPMFPPDPVVDYVTIAQLRNMYNDGIVTIDTNIYIQGIITLTPEFGNIPDFVAYIQDTTAGICLTITGTNALTMNSEVKILCRGISFTLYNGLLQFGDIDLTAKQVELIKLTAEVPEPVSVTIDELLNGEHQAEYVSVTGVQFDDPGTFSGGKDLTDCNSVVEVYTRSVATFSGTALPTGNGTFKGIASVFFTTQLLLRDPSELDMTGDICGVPSVTYLSQDFNTLSTNNTNVTSLTGWKTYSEAGTKTWFSYKTSTLGPFIETTAYGSGQPSVITWMIAPQIDLSPATNPYISFESADGYDNGATLELFVSTDYNGSATPWTSTWTKLNFTLPPSIPRGTYPAFSAFVSSGKIELSAYIGSTLYIAWVYKGADVTPDTNDKTTTWEVDNVLIAEE
ncbi:MAG: DUF5689 domain-containing protein [Bacteroidales bacterium]|jgi:hypothetical protein|nr:DUF5689 domain-containing protein [Bacteroidales bacterium]